MRSLLSLPGRGRTLACLIVAASACLPQPALAWWWFTSSPAPANARDLRAFRREFGRRFAPLPASDGRSRGGVRLQTGDALALSSWPSLSRTLRGARVSASGPWMPFLGARQSLSLVTGRDSQGDLASGMDWRARFGAGAALGVHWLYNAAPGGAAADGQMLVGMTGSTALPLGPRALKLSAGFSAMGTAGGGFLQVAGQAFSGLSVSVRGARYAPGFHPVGFVATAGERLLRARAAYHFSSGMRLSAYSQVRRLDDTSLDVEAVDAAGLTLHGRLFASFGDRGADVSLSSSLRRERGRSGLRERRLGALDFSVTQPLWLGWDSRIGVEVAHFTDRVANRAVTRGTISFAGHHRVRLGPFRGTVGPGIAWRRTGMRHACELEAGLRLSLASSRNSLSLDLGYEPTLGGAGSAPGAFRTMLSYRAYLGRSGAPPPSHPWYHLTLADNTGF